MTNSEKPPTSSKFSAPTAEESAGMLIVMLCVKDPNCYAISQQCLAFFPNDSRLLLLAIVAALDCRKTSDAINLLARYEKRFPPSRQAVLLLSLALGQQKKFSKAWEMLESAGLDTEQSALRAFVGGEHLKQWLIVRHREIARLANLKSRKPAVPVKKPSVNPKAASKPTKNIPKTVQPKALPAKALPHVEDLPRLEAKLDIGYDLSPPSEIAFSDTCFDSLTMFRLRHELVRLSLFEGFDELLCVPALQGVEPHWYQIETVRKVLKQYRGRVLLADEVGLGKTVEAGMILKEYILRGMAERVLILTPAALVGQWRDEMSTKFGVDCATSHDPLLRSDPDQFWRQNRIIASISLARRKEHAERLAALSYDVVVVDEAHHLRDQASASYRLVNSLQKRFLLLLSATPVQNSLLELYNLLTLLQPGIFKTQKDFRSVYMVPGKPREPANREKLRDLMRGVMVRNTRALAALKMPRRHAFTLRATPRPEEASCYETLSQLVREAAKAEAGGDSHHRLSLQHLLSAAGSSPGASVAAIERFMARTPGADPRWSDLLARTKAIAAGAKEATLLKLLAENPGEKKLVFIHHRDSLAHIADRLRRDNIPFVLFAGDMTGPQKDAAVEAFRGDVPLLLCTESGGEGRNLQFCNTLINFDIPWNPMAIEQRIGRIDRIGQTREVFIFNLVASGSIEDAMLRILDEKINMFELVVGEVGAILGEVDEQQDFSTMMLDAWLQASEPERAAALVQLENQLLAARETYEGVKQLDEALFGDDLDAA